MHPIYRKPKNGCHGSVPWVQSIGSICRPTTQTPSITNCLVAIVHNFTQSQLIAILVPKLVAMAKSLSTSGPYLTHDFYGPSEPHNPNGISICSAIFAQMTAECGYSLQWDAPFHIKFAPSHGWSGPPSNTWFLGSTRVLNPNGISNPSGSLV